MRFSDIPGYIDIKAKLVASVQNNNLAHALLFDGEKGAWNLPLALAFSNYIHCENRQANDSCGECTACSQYDKFAHPDLNLIFPLTSQPKVKSEDLVSRNFLKPFRNFLTEKMYRTEDEWADYIDGTNKSFNISKEESRQIIQNLSLKSFTGGTKLMLIWLPEYLHISAANGILKILEEPTDDTVFMLITQASERIIGTIKSRTRQIKVRKPNREEVMTWLQEHNGNSTEEAAHLSIIADGNLNEVLGTSEESNLAINDLFRNWLLSCYKLDVKGIYEHLEGFTKMTKKSQRGFLKYGQNVIRDCFLINSGMGKQEFSNAQYEDFISKLSKLFNASRIERFTSQLSETAYHLERNANPKLTFLNLSMQISAIFRE